MEHDYLGILHSEKGEEFFITKLIGKGATSFVYLSSGKDCKALAIKLYIDIDAFTNETTRLSELISSKNIVKLISCGKGKLERGCSINNFQLFNHFDTEVTINYGIFEYLNNGELYNYVLLIGKEFTEEISQKIFLDIVKGLEECHKSGISHGDVKLENIMLSSNYSIKLIDFGFAKRKEEGLISEITGTSYYAAPECYQGKLKGYDGISSDIFSLGVVLFVLVLGYFPFEKPSLSDHRFKCIIKKDFLNFWKKCEKIYPDSSTDKSQEFKDLFQKMICNNPKDRISLKEIKSHPWLSNLIGIIQNNKTIPNNPSTTKSNLGPKKHSNKFNKTKESQLEANNNCFNSKKGKNIVDTVNSKEENNSNCHISFSHFPSSPNSPPSTAEKENELKTKNNNSPHNSEINKLKELEIKYIKELTSRKISIDEMLDKEEL